jgi:hypothetical protein
MRIRPTQLGLVFFYRGLVCLFVTPTDHGVVSGPPNDAVQHAAPPRLSLQSIAQGPTADMQRRVSLTLCSRTLPRLARQVTVLLVPPELFGGFVSALSLQENHDAPFNSSDVLSRCGAHCGSEHGHVGLG